MAATGRSFLRHAATTLDATAILTAGMTPAASVSPSPDSITNASPNVYGTARDITNAPGVPEETPDVLNKGIDFLTGEGEGESDFNIPDQAPKTSQFLLPTVADKCIGGKGRSFGLATMVLGPADLLLPGVPENRFGFIFTGLGTKQLAKEQNTEMNIYWANIANGKYGKITLKNNSINAEEGPGVISGTVDTGKGLVTAVMQGGTTTQEEPGSVDYNYTPTAGVFPVGLS